MGGELLSLLQSGSYGDVKETLEILLEECCIDDLPARQEVDAWRAVLAGRGGRFSGLAEQCSRFWAETEEWT